MRTICGMSLTTKVWPRCQNPVSRTLRPMCSSISELPPWTWAAPLTRTHSSLCCSDIQNLHLTFDFTVSDSDSSVVCSRHRKSSEDALKERRRVSGLFSMMEHSLLQFYISRQWLNKFKTFAEPGPISNDDFLCSHGGTCDTFLFLTDNAQRSKQIPPRALCLNSLERLCCDPSYHSSCLHPGRGFFTQTKTVEYSPDNEADFKRGFYSSLCRWSIFLLLEGKRERFLKGLCHSRSVPFSVLDSCQKW